MTYQDHIDVIMFLLEKGADPNQAQVLSWVMTRYCYNIITESEFIEMFHRMIEAYGADVNAREDGTNAPWILTVVNDLMDEDLMISGVSNNERLWTEFLYVIISTFLKHHGDINIQNTKTGSTILSTVCDRIKYGLENERIQNLYNVVKFLLRCSDVGYGCCLHKAGYKAIHKACQKGDTTLVQMLLEAHNMMKNDIPMDRIIRSKIVDKDKYQTTAFHVMCHYNNHGQLIHNDQFIPIVKLLLQYNANVNAQDSKGSTILHQFVSGSRDDRRETIVKFLLEDCNADYLTIRNNNGQTAWDMNRMHRNQENNNIILHHVVMEQKRRLEMFTLIRLFCTTRLGRG
jgi:ankyrin repeat protein